MPQIPQIIAEGPHPERLGVPEAPRVPEQNPVYQAADEFNSKIAGIGDALQHQQTIMDAATAMTNYRGRAMAARDQALKTPPDPNQPNVDLATQQINVFNKMADPSAMISDPKNVRIAPLLQEHLPEIRQQFAEETQLGAQKNWEDQQKAQATVSLDQMAAQYPQADSADQARILGTVKSVFDSLQAKGAMTATERVIAEHQWREIGAVGTLTQLATTRPGAAQITQMTAPPPDVPANKFLEAKAQAKSTLEYHSELVEADQREHHALAIQQLDAMQAAHDPMLGAQVVKLNQGGWLTDDEAKHYVPGYERPSNPAVVADYMAAIKADPKSINPAIFLDPRISSADRAKLNLSHSFYTKIEDTEVGAANKLAHDQVERAFTPTDPGVIHSKTAMAIAEVERRQAVSEYESKLAAAKSGADVYKARDETLKLYGKTVLPPLGRTLTPAELHDMATRVRGAGLAK